MLLFTSFQLNFRQTDFLHAYSLQAICQSFIPVLLMTTSVMIIAQFLSSLSISLVSPSSSLSCLRSKRLVLK